MKTDDEDPDADREINSKTNEKSLTYGGEMIKIMPKSEMQIVNELNNAIANAKSDKNIQILVVFEKRDPINPRVREWLQNFCKGHPEILWFFEILGMGIVTAAVFLGFLYTCDRLIGGPKIFGGEIFQKTQQIEQQYDQAIEKNTIRWNDVVNNQSR